MKQVSDIKLEKIDEAYYRVISDDRGILMELSEFFTFFVPGYKFMPAFKNKMWDGKLRLLDMRTSKIYTGLLMYIRQFCSERDYTLEVEDFKLHDDNIDWVDWLTLGKLKPRDYQNDAIKHSLKYHNALLVSPTASGKSLIIYLLIRYFMEYNKTQKILLIVPTTSLVKQMYGDFADYSKEDETFCPTECHQIMAGKDKNADTQIYISTWQSIYKMPKQCFEDYGAVIGDEAHLFKAVSLTKIMTKLTDCKYRIGLTGTLDDSKTHKLVLTGLFGMVNKVVSTSELIERKQLANLKIKCLNLKYPETESKKVYGVKYFEELEYLTQNNARNKYIRNLTLALNGNTLCLFQLVEKHGEILYKLIKEKVDPKRKVFFVYGGTETNDREKIRAITEKSDNAIIIASFGTFSTGINIRNLHNIVFSSPSKSPIRILQSIGRGLRVGDNKDSATVYDISDDLTYKDKKNFTLTHFQERVNIYNREGFDYEIHTVDLK